MEEKKTQVCRECGRDLPLEKFQKNYRGYYHVCRECSAKKKGSRSGSAVIALQMDNISREPFKGIPDGELIGELIKRGWSGTISKEVRLGRQDGRI